MAKGPSREGAPVARRAWQGGKPRMCARGTQGMSPQPPMSSGRQQSAYRMGDKQRTSGLEAKGLP